MLTAEQPLLSVYRRDVMFSRDTPVSEVLRQISYAWADLADEARKEGN